VRAALLQLHLVSTLSLVYSVLLWNHYYQEVTMPMNESIAWSECPLVEVKSTVQSGAPVLRGTRLPVSAIIDNFDYGLSVEEIAQQFEVSPDRVQAILAYAENHRVARPVR
jgi:uncharacterized protein (DUF433 family)